MKKMKFVWAILCISIIAIGCESSGDYAEKAAPDPAVIAFEKNAITAQAYLDAWQTERIDYDSYFAKDYSAWGTGFQDTDTTSLEQMIEWDKKLFEMYDFKIVNEPINFLPGVDIETKKIDGSVRNYSEWEITKSSTDSTAAKTGILRMYQAYVFNEEGKMTLTLTYGDFGGLLSYLHSKE
jgi:hypothetical protein